jgi:pimeloyl-ACP methyl ester carboxylesterase
VAAALAAQDRRIFAAFPHNAVLTELSETASSISRLPKLLLKLYKPAVGWLRFMSKLFPRLPVPLWLYLDPRRISQDVSLLLAIGRDPLTIKSYSLKFVVSLITQTYPELTDASATSRLYLLCPTQDMLFPLAYSELVFSKIKFPHKEMVLLPGYGHLFMVSDPVQAAQAISAKMLEALSFATI